MSVDRFLKQRAVNITVNGNYMLHRWYDPQGRLKTYPCRTTRVSPFRMIVDVPVVGRIGDRLTSYFGAFGEFEGSISDTMHGSFLLELEMTREKRERMAEQLTWFEKKQKDLSILEQREDHRIVPQKSHSTLTLADGSIHSCFIIDMSLAGASIAAELDLPVGTPLAVGACVGRVIRVFSTGVAIKFVEKQSHVDDLERLFLRADQKQAVPTPVETLPPALDSDGIA